MRPQTILNKHFRVKVYGYGYNTLVGFAGLRSIVGFATAKLLVLDAFSRHEWRVRYNRRNGLQITFYSK